VAERTRRRAEHDMSKRFKDTITDWRFTGGTIKRVAVDVSGEPYLDLEREAAAMRK
jgi:hypothetical protein